MSIRLCPLCFQKGETIKFMAAKSLDIKFTKNQFPDRKFVVLNQVSKEKKIDFLLINNENSHFPMFFKIISASFTTIIF